MIVAGCEPKLGKDRAWGVGKKKQVHGEKAGLLDLLSGSCKYLGKRDSECISYLYPDTCLFLLKRPGSQGTWERHAGGWRMAKNEAGHQRTGTHFVSDRKILPQTSANGGGGREGEGKWRGAVSGAWWGNSWGADRSAWPTASSSGSRLGGMGAVQEGWEVGAFGPSEGS